MPPGRLTLTSHVPRRDHTRKSGTCSRHPDRVWNRRRNGCEHTSTSSPAKSRTSSSRCSWMLSKPWWRPVPLPRLPCESSNRFRADGRQRRQITNRAGDLRAGHAPAGRPPACPPRPARQLRDGECVAVSPGKALILPSARVRPDPVEHHRPSTPCALRNKGVSSEHNQPSKTRPYGVTITTHTTGAVSAEQPVCG